MPQQKQLRGRSVLIRDSPVARRTRTRNAFMDLPIEEDAPVNPLVEASQSFSQYSELVYGSGSQADNSGNLVTLLTTPQQPLNARTLPDSTDDRGQVAVGERGKAAKAEEERAARLQRMRTTQHERLAAKPRCRGERGIV